MKQDAFSRCHPVVNFIFFMGAIVTAAVIWHPVYTALGLICAAVYYLLLGGQKAFKRMALLLPLAVLVAAVNPVFNTRGETELFLLFGRPYTLQALVYGAVVAGILYAMLIWFGSYSVVMTGDKFTSLFGNLLPSVSLLLVMVFRLVPNLLRKIKQIMGVRKSVGKGGGDTAKEKLEDGATVVSAVTTWALEGSLVTGDSMRSRGYGTSKRTSFQIYRMTLRDWVLLSLQILLLGLLILGAALGKLQANFLPVYTGAKADWPLAVYGAYLLIPVVLQLWERICFWNALKHVK